jgi:hypothetical protein
MLTALTFMFFCLQETEKSFADVETESAQNILRFIRRLGRHYSVLVSAEILGYNLSKT